MGEADLPDDLWKEVVSRYQIHGVEYATDEMMEVDGELLPINACMTKDNLQDVAEELVDAVFNMLVYHFREGKGNKIIAELVYLWRILNAERESIE